VFSVGDKIVYPMHGAGVIQDIEILKILGEKKQYYVLKLPCKDIDIKVPVESGAAVGIRPVAAKEVVEDVVCLLRSESPETDRNWSRRYRENMEKIKSGDIMRVAEVVRDLMRMDREKALSAGESKMLDNARQVLISEMILAADMESRHAEELVLDCVLLR